MSETSPRMCDGSIGEIFECELARGHGGDHFAAKGIRWPQR